MTNVSAYRNVAVSTHAHNAKKLFLANINETQYPTMEDKFVVIVFSQTLQWEKTVTTQTWTGVTFRLKSAIHCLLFQLVKKKHSFRPGDAYSRVIYTEHFCLLGCVKLILARFLENITGIGVYVHVYYMDNHFRFLVY